MEVAGEDPLPLAKLVAEFGVTAVGRHRPIEVELAELNQLQRHRGRNRLGHRGDVVGGVRARRPALLHVREAETLGQDHLALPDDRHGHPRNVGLDAQLVERRGKGGDVRRPVSAGGRPGGSRRAAEKEKREAQGEESLHSIFDTTNAARTVSIGAWYQ
jgi:hypothetical protein